jgi:putative FmdB family regulatory protein
VPIYEYRCPNGHTFEVFHKMTEAPPDGCPVCAAGPVEKILFPVAVHFKGSGFYATDYGRGSRKAAKEGEGGGGGEKAAAETSSSSSSSSSSSTPTPSSDAKPSSDSSA